MESKEYSTWVRCISIQAQLFMFPLSYFHLSPFQLFAFLQHPHPCFPENAWPPANKHFATPLQKGGAVNEKGDCQIFLKL
jgi:hypothetical protein